MHGVSLKLSRTLQGLPRDRPVCPRLLVYRKALASLAFPECQRANAETKENSQARQNNNSLAMKVKDL